MSWVLCISGAALAKAGSKRNIIFSDVYYAVSGAAIVDRYSDESEATFCGLTGRDWIGLSAATLTQFKGMIADAVSSDIGKKIIIYNPSGYTARGEWTKLLDVLTDNYEKIVAKCSDVNVQKKMIT